MHAARAQALGQLGRFQEGLEAFAVNASLQGDPADFQGACWCAQRLQDWKVLEAQADLYLARHPGLGEPLAYRGMALTRQGRYAEAEPVLRQALAADARIAFAWINLSCCLNEAGRPGEAREAATQALQLEPGNPEAHSNRGRAWVGLKRYREARPEYVAALASGDPAVVANARLNLRTLDAYLAPAAKGIRKP